MCLMVLWLDEGVKNMPSSFSSEAVFHTGQLINVSLGLWFAVFFNLLNKFRKKMYFS